MSDVRALLLTDVVDSTRLSGSLGDAAMAALWARHDRIARDLVAAHRGREIDKTDGFLLLFDDVRDAVACAVAYHRAIGTLGIGARAGIHVGPVLLTENAPQDVARGAKPLEVDGIAKPIAARVMSAALGGQTLLTGEAVAALGPTPLRVEAHGHWRMKGVAEPVALFEVGEPTAPFTAPPDGEKVYRVVQRDGLWLPVREVPHHLPAERDAFVGRSADLQELAARVDAARLVSVLGIGGTGKTRLVTRFAWTWLGDFPGGAFFCDLCEARSVDGIGTAVAQALDVPLGTDPIRQLGRAIAGRGRCLVVLDNFEQVARHARETVGSWLDQAPDARFVVTTREVLGLPGESALPLAPLDRGTSVALFVERARHAARGFELTDADRPAVEALVGLLDHLPLAIELAAARVRVMPPALLLQRMSERFRLLASAGGRHTRQATLRGALDWSWELLSADEQAGLAQLSAFEGGFTLEAAEGVLALGSAWPMDVVQALVDKSLVRRAGDGGSGAGRFHLLVSVQEYAAEKLVATGARDAVFTRHGAYFAGFGSDEAIEARWRHGGVALRHALGRDLDNLVAACRRAVARGDGRTATLALVAAWSVLELRGPYGAGLELARTVAAVPGLSAADESAVAGVAMKALDSVGRWGEALAESELALTSGAPDLAELWSIRGRILRNAARHDEAVAAGERALELALASGNRRLVGLALGNLGVLRRDQGRGVEARDALERALQIHREMGNRLLEGGVLANLGLLALDALRHEDAVALLEAALEVHREVGNRRFEATVLNNLGAEYRLLARMDEARPRFEEALAIARETGDRPHEGLALLNLGHLERHLGRADEAQAMALAALEVASDVGDLGVAGAAHEVLGSLARARGDLDAARTHHECMRTAMGQNGQRINELVARIHLAQIACDAGDLSRARELAVEALSDARAAGFATGEGAALALLGRIALDSGSVDEARACLEAGEPLLRDGGAAEDLGVLLCVRARHAAAIGDRHGARRALGEAQEIAVRLGVGSIGELGLELERTAALVESA